MILKSQRSIDMAAAPLVQYLRCEYCGISIQPPGVYSCAGCGAPLRAQADYIEVTTIGDQKRQFIKIKE
jgi:DNA-directed RNA polymerase subunit RPC12/RpoP